MAQQRGIDGSNITTHTIYVAPPELYAYAWPAFLGFAPEATAHGGSAANRKCSCQGRHSLLADRKPLGANPPPPTSATEADQQTRQTKRPEHS